MRSLSFFQFMANLEQYGSRIPGVTLTFSLIVTFYLTKTENGTKKCLTQLSHYCFEERSYFWQKMLIFCKRNADIGKINEVWVLKEIFSENTYVRVLTYQILSFYHNSNEFYPQKQQIPQLKTNPWKTHSDQGLGLKAKGNLQNWWKGSIFILSIWKTV